MRINSQLTVRFTQEEAYAILGEFEDLNIGCEDEPGSSNDEKCPLLAELNELLQGEL